VEQTRALKVWSRCFNFSITCLSCIVYCALYRRCTALPSTSASLKRRVIFQASIETSRWRSGCCVSVLPYCIIWVFSWLLTYFDVSEWQWLFTVIFLWEFSKKCKNQCFNTFFLSTVHSPLLQLKAPVLAEISDTGCPDDIVRPNATAFRDWIYYYYYFYYFIIIIRILLWKHFYYYYCYCYNCYYIILVIIYVIKLLSLLLFISSLL
jgi:hypothetical protein